MSLDADNLGSALKPWSHQSQVSLRNLRNADCVVCSMLGLMRQALWPCHGIAGWADSCWRPIRWSGSAFYMQPKLLKTECRVQQHWPFDCVVF